jgi:hypothetical protein
MIDFNAFRKNSTGAKPVPSPREIYLSLASKAQKLSPYPRDVQGEVWQQWFDRRSERNLVVKMNTGGGKTIVGLLILQSCIEEGISPVVYVTPNKMLASQALEEAMALGVAATLDVNDQSFRAGKCILITHIHKIVNGQSVFGVRGGWREILNLGAIVFDDAHISLETIEEQFSIKIPKGDNGLYRKIFDLFYNSLVTQSPSRALEMSDGAPHRQLLVPFWIWQNNLSTVIESLHPYRDSDLLKYHWPLVQEHLKHSHCVISSESIEITPHSIPVAMIPSIANAPRRVFMTATLADDSVLSSHFGVDPKTIVTPIVPKSAGDVGDRMILAPQVVDPTTSDEQCMTLARQLADEEKINVIVIVPSKQRSAHWKKFADDIWFESAVDEGVARLRAGETIGVVVLVNRYDGIDLAGDACRVLILDGLPDVRRSIEVIKQGYLLGSQKVTAQLAQRIEQGAGRGVRSIDDYCAVILMGKSLCAHVYTKGVREKFSPATRAQIDLSEEMASAVSNLSGVKSVIQGQFLKRDLGWVSLSKGRLSNLGYAPPTPDPLYIAIREAFDYAEINDYSSATEALRNCCASLDDKTGGLARQYLADYVNTYDSAEAQKIQRMAVSKNRQLLKPIAGITFSRAETASASQARGCLDFASTFQDGNHYSVAIQSIIENLSTGEDFVPRFEQALSDIAQFIGFKGSRPEQEGEGPDILWSMKNQQYIVIECKSGASAATITKTYCNQLNGSKIWFDRNYADCIGYQLMIHPSSVIETAASLTPGTRVMTFSKLDEFKETLRAFGAAMALKFSVVSSMEVRALLVSHNLHASKLFEHFSQPFQQGR